MSTWNPPCAPGPGCSSLGGGFLAELGPFFPRPDAQALYKNIYAFNKVANIIFLDSPAFTGFSYSNTSADATVGDSRTAQDSRKFLSGFFDRFPQYRCVGEGPRGDGSPLHALTHARRLIPLTTSTSIPPTVQL